MVQEPAGLIVVAPIAVARQGKLEIVEQTDDVGKADPAVAVAVEPLYRPVGVSPDRLIDFRTTSATHARSR